MPYLSSFSIDPNRTHPFPYDVPAVRFAKNIALKTPVTFLIGDNGTGKSTLLELLAYRLQLPHMDGSGYQKKGFKAARTLLPHLELSWERERSTGFFFRAEDFGNLINSIDRQDGKLHGFMADLEGAVPDHIIQEMKDSANHQIHHMRKRYGQDLQSFSHGEAYLKIMQEKIVDRGLYLLDEPEAALSPLKQLSLLYFMQEHLRQFTSQLIIATHSPMLMAFPGATIYEVNQEGMKQVPLEETEHYTVTRSFLNDPGRYLRHLG
ncbi:AAA family ATPase [Maribacter sp. 2307ULW6-5]|uniref:AAA family ATPase n=1 Tax=Maribacter sp. 2307ULW6-5 TaxID=3386275 RepID=UPI0039BD7355